MRHLIVTDSDIIESVGFEHSKKLEVVFKSSPDTIYHYEGVNADSFITLITAESIGKSFHEMFRKTKHPFTKSERKQTLKK